MGKLKVLMLTSSYPIEGSNLGPFVQNIVKGLVKKHVEVGVMIFSATGKYKEYKQDGATIYEYPYSFITSPRLHRNMGLIPSAKSSFVAKTQLPGYLMSTMWNLSRIAKKYDVIHAHWYLPAGLIACMIKGLVKKPILTTAWGAEFHLHNNIFTRKLLNFVNDKSDVKIAVSEYMRGKATEYNMHVKDMKVIPNSIDTNQFSLKRKKSKKVVIATIRRLVPEKRVQDLIKAVELLPDDLREEVELWIIGDGPERLKLEKSVSKLGLKKITKFFGMVPHKKIPALLSKIDVYVNPSIQEGMATANLEAMAAGACVIATNGVGNDEVIEDGKNGLLYEYIKSSSFENTVLNAKGLSDKLKVIVSDGKLRDSIRRSGIAKVKKMFSNDSVAGMYLKEYKRIA